MTRNADDEKEEKKNDERNIKKACVSNDRGEITLIRHVAFIAK